MLFILRDPERVNNCIEYIKEAGQSLKTYCVEVKEYKRSRTQAQNRTMHMWYKDISDHTGYLPEELHDMARARFLGTATRRLPAAFGGEEKELVELVSTTSLTTKEMAEYLNKLEALAIHLGAKLRYPDDYKYAVYAE